MAHEDDHNPGLNEQRETANLDAEGKSTLIGEELEASIQSKIRRWAESQPRRETISSDKTGGSISNPIDNQIQNGVDFFDDDSGSHTGFVPKTDLVSRYHQMKDAIIAPTWNTGAARVNTKTRTAYGVNGEYIEELGVGLSVPSHILEGDNVGPARENYPMNNWSSLLPIERQSMYAKVANNAYQFHRHGTIPPGDMDIDIYPAFDVSDQMTLYGVPNLEGGTFSWPNTSVYAPSAIDTAFMTTPISDFSEIANSSLDHQSLVTSTHSVPSITSTAEASTLLGTNADYLGTSNLGPFGINVTPLTYPSSDGTVNGSLVQLWQSTSALRFEYGEITVEPEYEGTVPLDSFLRVPSGLTNTNLFGTGVQRSVSNSGPFEGDSLHPIVIRDFGSNWKESGVGSAPAESIDHFGLITDLYLNMGGATHERYKRWSESTAGVAWLDLQARLQLLNPTLETTDFKPKAVILDPDGNGTIGYRHITRHTNHIENRYEKMLKVDEFPSFITDNFDVSTMQASTVGTTSIQDQSIFGFGSRIAMQSRYNITPDVSLTVTYGDMSFNTEIGVEEAPMTQLIYFSNPNRYNRDLSSAPVNIVDGQPSFIVNKGAGEGSTAESDANKILSTQGSTFNSQTHFNSTDDAIGISKKYATLAYGRLNQNFSYERQLESPSEVTGLLDEGDSGAVGIFPDASLKGEVFGLKFEVGVGNNPRRLKQSQRRKDKKINDDVGTVKNVTKLLDTSLEETVDPVLGVVRRSVTDTGGIASGVSDAVDKINYTRYGDKDIVDGENVYYVEDGAQTTRDFIKFRFYDVVNAKYIIFRAILSGISDSITTDYNEDKYIGRPDKLYTYRGADRNVSFNFKVYPKTKQELPMLMEKMNYLVGLCYPSMGALGRMKSPFIQLTLGDMIAAQPGILRNVTVSVDDNTTWEIQQGLQFPKHINVAVQFTYIGNHLPIGTSNGWYGGLKPDQIEPKTFVDILKGYVNYDFGSSGNTLVDSALELIGDNKKLKEAQKSFNKYAGQLGFKV